MERKFKTIELPKPPAEAFNKNRPAGKLLQAQIAHLRKALTKHYADVMAILAIDLREIRTEGDVSDYAKKVMAILHPHGGRPRN